jgi:hypothetical protein
MEKKFRDDLAYIAISNFILTQWMKESNQNVGELLRATHSICNYGEEPILSESIRKLFLISRNQLIRDNPNIFPHITYVSILSSSDESEFVKIGVCSSIEFRHSFFSASGYRASNFLLYGYQTREEAISYEKKLHNLFKDLSYMPKIKFSGYTECFNYKCISKLIKYHGIT